MKAKLLHIVSSLNVGGAEKFVKNLAIEQLQRGDNVKVISFGSAGEPFQSIIEQAGVEVVNLRGNFFSRAKQLIQQLKSADIVHIHSPSVIRAILPIFPYFLIKRVIYTIHGEVDPPQNLLTFSHQVARLYLNHIVAVSPSAKNSVTPRYGWSSENIGVIKNGVTLANRQAVQTGNIKLGVVSRLIPLKNIPMLFDAITLLPEPMQKQVELQVFGDGPEMGRLQEKAAQMSKEVVVKFHGNVIDELSIYKTFDVLVMCSNTEGLPMSILEAMAYGIPVISTDVGAISKVVIDQETGWLYPAKGTEQLVGILMKLIRESEKVARAGAKAKELIKENYDISMVSRDYKQLYES